MSGTGEPGRQTQSFSGGKPLHSAFEGSDFLTKVWVNGQFAGSHRGGYARFSFDITDLMREGENELVVKAEDSFDAGQPRGKQRWVEKNFGCWYVQTTGIWKTVWCEYVPPVRLERGEDDAGSGAERPGDGVRNLRAGRSYRSDWMIETVITFEDVLISRTLTAVTKPRITAVHDLCAEGHTGMEWAVRAWSPETPDLYDVEFRLLKGGKLWMKRAPTLPCGRSGLTEIRFC